MSNFEWKLVKLGDLLEITHGYAFKGEFFREEPPGDFLLSPGNFAIGGGFKSDKFKYYIGDVPENFVLTEGDILITMTDLSKAADTLGYPAIIPKSPKNYRFLHNQRLGKVIINFDGLVDKIFLYYQLRTNCYRNEVLASATGTTVKHTSPNRIKVYQFYLPPLPEQKAIARILSSLDDKIELNRQMNETLEAIAQTIFKSWFVNFDPVRAKIEGRQPAGMDAATAALFPDELEESSLGQIPKGWKVKAVGDLVDIKHGYAFKGEFFRTEPPGDILLTPGNFARGGGFKDDKFKYYIGEVPEDFVLDEGDLLVSMTDLSKAGDTLGYPALIPPPRKSLYLHNQRLGKVIVKLNVPVSKFHLYYLLRTDEYRHEVLASATGTTVKHTSPDRIKNFKFPFPNNETSLRFGEVIAPMYEKFSANQEESRTLAAIRDTLLPKLMAGEIQVKDLENLAGNIRNPHHHF